MGWVEVIPFLAGLGIITLTAQLLVGSMRSGSLRRNAVVGLRTSATLVSDEAWLTGHAAAVPQMARAARSGWLLLAASVLCAALFRPPVGFAVAGAGYLLVIGWLLAAAVTGHRAAKAVADALP